MAGRVRRDMAELRAAAGPLRWREIESHDDGEWVVARGRVGTVTLRCVRDQDVWAEFDWRSGGADSGSRASRSPDVPTSTDAARAGADRKLLARVSLLRARRSGAARGGLVVARQRHCRESPIHLPSGHRRSSLPAMTGTKAGKQADEIARRHREKIARLERSAVAWEAGAAGERATGDVFGRSPGSRLVRAARPAWPGRQKANIDHLVVGRGGIFVIDTKNWSGAVEVRDGVLRQNGRSRKSAVDGVRRAAADVQWLVPEVPMQPVLSLHGDLSLKERAGEVILCSTSTLREMLESRPAVLESAEVQRIGSVLAAAPAPGAPRRQRCPCALGATARHERRRGRGHRSEGWQCSC